jgi:hypothetical protein
MKLTGDRKTVIREIKFYWQLVEKGWDFGLAMSWISYLKLRGNCSEEFYCWQIKFHLVHGVVWGLWQFWNPCHQHIILSHLSYSSHWNEMIMYTVKVWVSLHLWLQLVALGLSWLCFHEWDSFFRNIIFFNEVLYFSDTLTRLRTL